MEEAVGKEAFKKIWDEALFFRSIGDPKPVGMMVVEGVSFPTPFMKMEALEAMKTWEARPDDVFVISYPKAGTTWTQEVVSAICYNGNLDEVNKCHTIFRVPFLETSMIYSTDEIKFPPIYELLGNIKSKRTIKSHLPGHLLPPDIMRKGAKIVYIARNPKDVAVSFYYFHKINPTLRKYDAWDDFLQDFNSGNNIMRKGAEIVYIARSPKDVAVSYYYFHKINPTLRKYDAWDEFLQDFNSGNIYSGKWWDHYLYFWIRRHEPNVLFLKFDDMKRDLRGIVEQIATFLEYKLSPDAIDRITEHCTFENMKANDMTNPDYLFKHVRSVMMAQAGQSGGPPPGQPGPGPPGAGPKEMQAGGKDAPHTGNRSFMRKGKVGDWRNHFTVAQNDAMDALIDEKLKGTGLKFD